MNRFAARFAIIVLVLASLLIVPLAGASSRDMAPLMRATGRVIPNQYIVVLKSGGEMNSAMVNAGVKARFVYNAAINGFAATLNASQLNALRHNPNVAYVEPDQVATIDTTQNMDANGDPWGLDRIDQRNLPLSRTYTYTHNGAGVYAYIIDTGLQANHPDFGGRAANVYDALGGTGADCNGHGTHVAGTIGSRTYGVAKGVFLRGVRVLDCNGSGSYSQVIAGVNWVASNHTKPAVANMSLGGSFSSAVNSAVANLVTRGVFIAVAAGNSNANACNFSPASTSTAYTVAASDKTDHKASFSNYGSCVDGYAPGVAIKSTWIGSSTNTISGTSMASPHVAGVGALYQSTFGTASPATITNWINSNATPNKIIGNPTGTPNRLLYKAGL